MVRFPYQTTNKRYGFNHGNSFRGAASDVATIHSTTGCKAKFIPKTQGCGSKIRVTPATSAYPNLGPPSAPRRLPRRSARGSPRSRGSGGRRRAASAASSWTMPGGPSCGLSKPRSRHIHFQDSILFYLVFVGFEGEFITTGHMLFFLPVDNMAVGQNSWYPW